MSKNFLTTFKIGNKAPFQYVYTIPGTLTVAVGKPRLYVTRAIIIQNVAVMVGTAPTGASAIFDINVNGTTIFSSGKPTITATNFQDAASVPTSPSVDEGDYITIDCDQIGSTIAGTDAVIVIEYI